MCWDIVAVSVAKRRLNHISSLHCNIPISIMYNSQNLEPLKEINPAKTVVYDMLNERKQDKKQTKVFRPSALYTYPIAPKIFRLICPQELKCTLMMLASSSPPNYAAALVR